MNQSNFVECDTCRRRKGIEIAARFHCPHRNESFCLHCKFAHQTSTDTLGHTCVPVKINTIISNDDTNGRSRCLEKSETIKTLGLNQSGDYHGQIKLDDHFLKSIEYKNQSNGVMYENSVFDSFSKAQVPIYEETDNKLQDNFKNVPLVQKAELNGNTQDKLALPSKFQPQPVHDPKTSSSIDDVVEPYVFDTLRSVQSNEDEKGSDELLVEKTLLDSYSKAQVISEADEKKFQEKFSYNPSFLSEQSELFTDALHKKMTSPKNVEPKPLHSAIAFGSFDDADFEPHMVDTIPSLKINEDEKGRNEAVPENSYLDSSLKEQVPIDEVEYHNLEENLGNIPTISNAQLTLPHDVTQRKSESTTKKPPKEVSNTIAFHSLNNNPHTIDILRHRPQSAFKRRESFKPNTAREESIVLNSITDCNHISYIPPGYLWISDAKGNLVRRNLQGQEKMLVLPHVTTSPKYGFHSSTADEDLLYIISGKDESIIKKVHSSDNTTISDVARIKDWEPISIYSSKLNGDIFVGVKKDERAKIIRFSQDGRLLQEIERDRNKDPIFQEPRYITGDSNGNIWVTDWNTKRMAYGKIIILDENGEYCSSYPQQKNERFYPAGISCVEEGPALVLEGETGKVMVLEKSFQMRQLDIHAFKETPGLNACGLCVGNTRVYVSAGGPYIAVYHLSK